MNQAILDKTEVQAKAQSVQLITGKIDNRMYGVDIVACKEVDNRVRMVKVPYAKDYIIGITNLRGEVVTVLNLGKLLDEECKSGSGENVRSIIRLKSKDNSVAIAVEELDDLITAEPHQIEAVPANLSDTMQRFISGVAKVDEMIIYILNYEELNGLSKT